MQSSNRFIARVATAAACLGLLGACASSEVRGAGAPVFPDLATATFAGGTYPNVDNLRAIAPGMTKDQLYDLIGRPHFHEGVFGVREWNYLFNFRDADGNASACQYQVRFDADALVESTHWKPSTCAGFLKLEAPAAPPPVVEHKTILSADLLFGFGSVQLTPQGRRALDDALGQLQGGRVESVEITGHADRIGSDADNDRLSAARARNVRRYLEGRGIDGQVIVAEGHGEREPLVACEREQGAALVACLAPNRRVELLIRLLR